MVISVAPTGTWHGTLPSVFQGGLLWAKQVIAEKTAVLVLAWQGAWQYFHKFQPIYFCGWAALPLLPAVLCCVCLGIPKHSECLGLTSPLWASLRQRSLCGPVVQVHRQHTLNQTEVAGHCGRDTSKLLFSFLLLILFISESVNGKNLAVSFDMSEWALLLPVADFHLEQNNLQSPAWGREMLMDKVTNITVQKHSCFLKNYLHDVFGGWWIAYVRVLVISLSCLDLPSGNITKRPEPVSLLGIGCTSGKYLW